MAAATTYPIVCNLGAIGEADGPRYEELVATLRSALAERRIVPGGYTWTVDTTAISLRDVAEWMDMERRCCPFLEIRLANTGGAESWNLTLSGPSGVSAILDSVFAADAK